MFIGDTQVSIASLKPVHLSSSPWPSLLILLGACVLIVGLWYLARTPLPLNVEDGEPAESVLEEPPDKAGG